jgi:hypothetical protein
MLVQAKQADRGDGGLAADAPSKIVLLAATAATISIEVAASAAAKTGAASTKRPSTNPI